MGLGYWNTIDARVKYALTKYPGVQLQLIPYGEDANELNRCRAGDANCLYIAKYAQARWSSFPNVQWCVANDLRKAAEANIIGNQMKSREPWGTLMTNHQPRGSGYDLVGAGWSDIVTLQVSGVLLHHTRLRGSAQTLTGVPCVVF